MVAERASERQLVFYRQLRFRPLLALACRVCAPPAGSSGVQRLHLGFLGFEHPHREEDGLHRAPASAISCMRSEIRPAAISGTALGRGRPQSAPP
jgi:hypothetical protein